MSKNKTKHVHFYPQFLLRNWGTFLDYYDLSTKETLKSNTSLKKVGSYIAQKQQRNYYHLYENNMNKKYNNIENLIAENLKIFKTENLRKNLRNEHDQSAFLKKVLIKGGLRKDINKFFNSLVDKAPITRGGKILQTFLNKNPNKPYFIDPNFDIDNLQMVMNSVKQFDKKIKLCLGNDVYFVFLLILFLESVLDIHY